MDLNKYAGLKVKVLLNNNYYYVGLVINADEDSIELKDVKGQYVSLNKKIILSIQEVNQR